MITLTQMSKEAWEALGEKAFECVFGHPELFKSSRHDYALMIEKDGEPVGFCTFRELDSERLYLCWGGIFHHARPATYILKVMEEIERIVLEKYDSLVFKVSTTNFPMLKVAIARQFVACGYVMIDGQYPFLEFVKRR